MSVYKDEYDKELSYNTIGGSDIGALTGNNKWTSPFQLLESKHNRVPFKKNFKMLLGNILEDTIAQVWASNKGVEVIGNGKDTLVLDDKFRVTIDRHFFQEVKDTQLEIKTRWMWWKEKTPPLYHVDQVNWNTGVLEDLGFFGNYFPGDPIIVTLYMGELWEVTIPYSREYYRTQKQIAEEFLHIMNNGLELNMTTVKKWKDMSSIFIKIYEDLQCRLISSLEVEQLIT